MKTKYFLLAAALPVAFASCSDDVLESVPTAKVDQMGRRSVKDVIFDFGNDATRMQFDGAKYTPEAGKDKIGAMLMDNVVYLNNYKDDATYNATVAAGNWMEFFDLINYTHTNFPFVYDGSAWKTETSVLSEGNYFFFSPMNEDGGYRDANVISLPINDIVYNAGDKATDVFSKYQKFIGYSKVLADKNKIHESLAVKMEPILTYAGVRIHNVGNTSEADKVTIHKIIIENGTGFVNKLTVDASGHDPEYKVFENAQKLKDDFGLTQRELLVGIRTIKTTTDPNAKIYVKYPQGKVLYGGEKTLAYFMAYPQPVTSPKLKIYTDKGYGEADLSAVHTADNVGVLNLTNDAILDIHDYVADGSTPRIINIEFDNTALAHPTTLDVENEQDLLDLINWSASTINVNLTATLVNTIEVSDAVLDALAKNTSNSLNIVTAAGKDVVVASQAAMNAISTNGKISLTGTGKIVVNGNVSQNADINGTNEIQVNGGATLDVNFAAADNVIVANNGTVNIKKAANLTTIFPSAIGGTVNINAAATGAITSVAKATINVNANTAADITNAAGATVNIATAKEFTGKLTNSGTVNNDGYILNTASENKENATIMLLSATAGVKLNTNAGNVDNTIKALATQIQITTNAATGVVWGKPDVEKNGTAFVNLSAKYGVTGWVIEGNYDIPAGYFAVGKPFEGTNNLMLKNGAVLTIHEDYTLNNVIAPAAPQGATITSGNPMQDWTLTITNKVGNITGTHVAL